MDEADTEVDDGQARLPPADRMRAEAVVDTPLPQIRGDIQDGDQGTEDAEREYSRPDDHPDPVHGREPLVAQLSGEDLERRARFVHAAGRDDPPGQPAAAERGLLGGVDAEDHSRDHQPYEG